MTSNIVTTEWKKNLLFKSDNPNGASVLMDTSFANGGNEVGASPKALMLSSLAGCSGLDVVKIAEKMRVNFDDLKIVVKANLTDEHPKFYDKVHVSYHFYGEDLNQEKLEKVVNLSIEKYCGVMEMFRQFATVTTEIIYNN
ncbi:OsmC family protein [Tenacibaculum agarivorans]|uniref:OsmC family protein n=1 Tax=Tenacibaculum agarivorans TaxID=1908389 RepID=UPI00094B7E96|nr:OsmC family protein [Tenacibaculum agarivorans]